MLDFLRSESFYPYIYPLGGLILGLCTSSIFILRKDLRKIIILMSFVLFPFATIAEYLFFQDYWYPPDFLDFNIGNLRVISGDLIMVITTPALFIVLIPFLFNLSIVNLEKVRFKPFALKIFLVQSLTTVVFYLLWYLTELNSIYCYILASIIIVTIILLKTKVKRFFVLYLCGILTMGTATFIFYLLYQLIVGDDYLKAVWLLDHTKLAIELSGILIPLTEVLFGAFVGPFYLLLVFLLEPSLKLARK